MPNIPCGAIPPDLESIALRQRVLRNVADLSTKTELFGETMNMPVMLAPVGLGGMYARRGEVQAARAAKKAGIPHIISTVSVCSLKEIVEQSGHDIWFQLYVLKDRGFMKDALERAQALGVTKLIFHRRHARPRCALSRPAFGYERRSWCFSPRRAGDAASGLGVGCRRDGPGRTTSAMSRPIAARRRGWRTISAGWGPISIRRFPGRI